MARFAMQQALTSANTSVRGARSMRTIMHTPMVSNRQPSGPHAQLYRYTQFGKGVQSHECSSVSTLRNIGLQRSMMAAQPHVSTAAAEEPRTSAPEVYTVPPVQPTEKKPGQLEKWQVEQFFEKGYVVVPSFFSPDELQPAIDGVNECVDIVANMLHRGGKIQDKCKEAGFYERLILIEKQFKGASVIWHKIGYLAPGFQEIWAHERLLNVAEQLVGPDIAGHPVWNLRTKTPKNEHATVPWHQDNAYLDPSALGTLQLTAWIPLIDTNATNGCMQVVSGGHRAGVTATHTCCAGDTWYVQLAEEELEKTLGVDMKSDVVTCEVPFGGVLFMNNAIPHRSLENVSDKIRWSMDWRWQHPDLPNGFYGLKDCVLMRKANDPGYKIDWTDLAGMNRQKLQEECMGKSTDEFDTTIHGPWMKRWEITHPNRHTASFLESRSS